MTRFPKFAPACNPRIWTGCPVMNEVRASSLPMNFGSWEKANFNVSPNAAGWEKAPNVEARNAMFSMSLNAVVGNRNLA